MGENTSFVQQFEMFLRSRYMDQLMDAAKNDRKSIEVSFKDLDIFNPDIAEFLLNEPERTMKHFNNAVKGIDLPTRNTIVVRIRDIPEVRNIRIRNLRAEHVGKMVLIDGVVRRATEVLPEISSAIFECPRCMSKITVEQTSTNMKKPAFCGCGHSGKFEMVDRTLFDARWITVEEPFDIVEGDKPVTINVYMKDDLTTPEMQRKTDPGNRLLITGILKEAPKSVKGKRSTRLDIWIDTVHVERTEIDFEDITISEEDMTEIIKLGSDPMIYDKLVASIAPSIYGLDEVKRAISLQLFGGVINRLADGTRIRGDIHILLMGDPSAGKSQILKLVSGIVPRGRYVSGTGASGAGLTATVTKDEQLGGWVLEAGALVLTNKGMISLDEFDKMNKDDVVAMHEAMEQQTISIAKASIIATLPSQTSILAGANPKFGRFDPYKSIAEQITIPDTLLSRFDIKFALRDVPTQEEDTKKVSHILWRDNKEKLASPISTQLLRKYIAYAKQNCKPVVTDEAKEEIKNFYLTLRGMSSGEGTPTIAITMRQLEALLRMTQASAKIRLSDKAEAEDARRAIDVMKASLKQLGWDPESGKIDIDRTEGMSASQRSRFMRVMDLMTQLEKTFGKTIPVKDLVSEALKQGIDNAEDVISKLKSEGQLFEPRHGFLQKL